MTIPRFVTLLLATIGLLAIASPSLATPSLATSAGAQPEGRPDSRPGNRPGMRVSTIAFKVPGGSEGVTIAGVLETPIEPSGDDSPRPTLVLLAGPRSNTRDGVEAGRPRLRLLADAMLKQGFAVVRYDKRGAGESTGDLDKATTEDLASDTLAIIRHLRGRDEVDPDRIAIVGHGEGGVIGYILAGAEDGPACVVSLAGAGIDGRGVINDQLVTNMRWLETPEEGIRDMRDLQDAFLMSVIEDAPRDKQREMLTDLTYRQYGGQVSMLRAEQIAETSLEWFHLPWTKTFLTLDPSEKLGKAKRPVLVLLGALDIEVSDERNAEPLRKAIERSGVAGSEVRVLPGKNHHFQNAETGWYGEYEAIEHAFAPDVPEIIGRWLRVQFGG